MIQLGLIIFQNFADINFVVCFFGTLWVNGPYYLSIKCQNDHFQYWSEKKQVINLSHGQIDNEIIFYVSLENLCLFNAAGQIKHHFGTKL